MLQFTNGNAKLGKATLIFDIPAGHTCNKFNECYAKIDRYTGKMIEGGKTFRCYAANAEMYSPAAREFRWRNYDQLLKCKTVDEYFNLIHDSLLARDINKIALVRIHSSGDFFNEKYFIAWLRVAIKYPEIKFYAYTKNLLYWVGNAQIVPTNFVLTASYGGKFDQLIEMHKLKYVKVVFFEEEAEVLGLELDHDDTHAYKDNKPFAILLHGTQPKNSIAMASIVANRKKGNMGYDRKTKGGGRRKV